MYNILQTRFARLLRRWVCRVNVLTDDCHKKKTKKKKCLIFPINSFIFVPTLLSTWTRRRIRRWPVACKSPLLYAFMFTVVYVEDKISIDDFTLCECEPDAFDRLYGVLDAVTFKFWHVIVKWSRWIALYVNDVVDLVARTVQSTQSRIEEFTGSIDMESFRIRGHIHLQYK